MYDPKAKPPAECGNFLSDLPRYLGLEDPAFEREAIYPHYRGCPRCQRNLTMAREIAGAFHGIKALRSPLWEDARTITVEKAVSIALRQNRAQLAEVFCELGKAFLIDAVRTPGWIALGRPRLEPQTARKRGISLANDSVLLTSEEGKLQEWNSLRENLVSLQVPADPERLLEESLRYLTIARKIAPSYDRPSIWIGLYHYRKGNFEDTLQENRLVIEKTSSTKRRVEALINSSDTHHMRGDFGLAADCAARACRIDPDEPTAVYNYASFSLMAGDRRNSFETFDRIEAEAETPSPLRSRAHQILSGFGPGPLADFFRRDPSSVDELERDFPRTFAPDVVERVRKEVLS